MYFTYLFWIAVALACSTVNYVYAVKNKKSIEPKMILGIYRRYGFFTASAVIFVYTVILLADSSLAYAFGRPATVLIYSVIVAIDATVTLVMDLRALIKSRALRVSDVIYIAASFFSLIVLSTFSEV